MSLILNDTKFPDGILTVPTSDTVSASVHLVCLVLLFFLCIFGTVINFIVFVIFYKRPSLRSISNRFVLSLTTANLISALVVAPIQGFRIGRQLLNLEIQPKGECLYIDPIFGVQLDWLCQTCRILTTVTTVAAILSVLLIAIDRYCAVTSPLHYSMTVTRGRSMRLIFGVWGLAIFYSTPLLTAKITNSREYLPTLCWPESRPTIVHRFGLYYSATLGVCGFLVPFLVLVWIYIMMYRVAMKNSERTRRHSVGVNHTEIIIPECPSTPETTNHHSVRGKVRIHRKRSSNSSLPSLFFREEGRAAKTGTIVISSFISSWMPYFIYKIIETFYCYLPYVQNIIVLLALSSSGTMPFIYVYRNETVRREAIKIICWWKSTVPANSTIQKNSMNFSFNRSSTLAPVTLLEPDTGKAYTYATECDQCEVHRLVNSLKIYRPMTISVDEVRKPKSPTFRQDFTTSSKYSQEEKPVPCRVCLQNDFTSSACSDDPLIGDRHKLAKMNSSSIKWMRHRLSNGSVTTRSDSLASTNSSILSYGVHKWPRRVSTFSTDSGGTFSKKSITDDSHEPCSLSGTPRMYQNHHHFMKTLSLESEDDSRDLNDPDFHIYSNPLRIPKPYIPLEEAYNSPNRFIWEIEETDCCEDEDIKDNKLNRPKQFKLGKTLLDEMDDLKSLKDIKRGKLFLKRFSQQEINVKSDKNQRQSAHLSSLDGAQSMTEIPKSICKYLKDEECDENEDRRTLKEKHTCSNNLVDQIFVHSSRSSVRSYDENLTKKPKGVNNVFNV